MPQRTVAAKLGDYIESVVVESSGVIGVVGWMAKDQPLDFPGVPFVGKKPGEIRPS